ncbi:tetratricopeptide repeat-containing sulfotransferase family protein [Prochlorococcus marinus]|uniref:tetratricopeptide repeat-containing sulfotransferase family protein n=1 Tax=Prochlorococcus marinus TaxID=1219 RepID=UPI0022B5C3C6|nr:tetratricopeptide repeat-containing sulfotransferase family protein [Prochlorococcus marinus]
MDQSRKKDQWKTKVYELITFPVPFPLRGNQENLTINTNTPSKPCKEELINQAIKLHSQGNIAEAAKLYQQIINQGCNNHKVFSNYGMILNGLGKLKEAEVFYRKAIEFNPDYEKAHSNLGNILRGLGKLKEAELSQRKAIELNPNSAEAHSNLGSILNDLGKLKEAELSQRKAIELNPDLALAHYNLGNILNARGKLKEAELSQRKAIELNPDLTEAHYNLGIILNTRGKLKEAEFSTRKAIELNPTHAKAHNNLGGMLKEKGSLEEAEVFLRKAIELNPDFAAPYLSLSDLKYSNKNTLWKDKLFSESILKNQSQKDQIDIYFARANILHKEKKYEESSKYLQLANNLKLEVKPSKPEMIFNKSKALLIESDKLEINQQEHAKFPESIFIVGMFRSGSTLLESILSMNTSVNDLGERMNLEESFLESKKVDQELTLAEVYWKKIKDLRKKANITTNKNLFNYQYTGIIAKKIPNAKIIHCFRNPLDNILSIYRAHFARGNEYSSSLVDCTRVYLYQDEIMTEYKNRFRSKIYDLDYDLLVSNPNKEIKSLISWLGWHWDDLYLSPHLNPRSVSTASTVQVRFPINSKSVGGWKNYKEMMKPAIKILIQTKKYRDLIS